MRRNAVRAVFCYAYEPGHLRDGGFAVNVFSNDMLSFTAFDTRRQPIGESCFILPRGTAQRLIRAIKDADDWLWNFPPFMSFKDAPDHISTIGLDGYPLFRLEDFQLMATLNEFRSIRGHYAREMMNLIEEVAAILDVCGFRLTLRSFTWLSGIEPVPPQPVRPADPEEEERRARIG